MFVSLGLLPVFQVSIATLAFLLSYVWSVRRMDVSPAFPFISDTGASRPESCFFSQMLNMSAFITFFIMYIRFKYVQLKIRLTEEGEVPIWVPRINLVSSLLGVIAAFGVSLVANFQGYTAHICSTAFEWVLALCFFIFFLTYVREFDSIESEVIFRPLAFQDRSGSIPARRGLENGRASSRSRQSTNSLYRHENVEPGERSSLLGTANGLGKTNHGTISA
ncbi:hypothetical protein EGW08_011741 [Elysia chlorotica]|uniref:CWH43-like N-terminal domain-containing protein n=1 Tax=Elysia chlorotica TaxID=188477 RepID=A0A433TG04_ELYCH|nr:hypothetical protein EGW08_011741 [Elysia chlorotica]